MKDRVLPLHPEPGKSGVNISKSKYDLVRDAIIESVRAHGEIAFKALVEDVVHRLEGQFEGSITWYVTTVKLDLEAREEIERVSGSRPQRLRLR